MVADSLREIIDSRGGDRVCVTYGYGLDRYAIYGEKCEVADSDRGPAIRMFNADVRSLDLSVCGVEVANNASLAMEIEVLLLIKDVRSVFFPDGFAWKEAWNACQN